MSEREPCEHGKYSIYMCSECCPIDPDKIRTVSIGFHRCEGRADWHGPTVKERVDEMRANAKKYGNPEPEYVGRRWI